MNVKKYFTHTKTKTILNWCIGVVLLSGAACLNIKLTYTLFKVVPNILDLVIDTYHHHALLFQSVPFLFHLYFVILLVVGLPLMVMGSFVFGLILLKNNRSTSKFLFNLFTPAMFLFLNYFLSKIWLSFV